MTTTTVVRRHFQTFRICVFVYRNDVVLQEDIVRREDANECEGGTVLVQYEEVRRGTKRDEFTAVEKVLQVPVPALLGFFPGFSWASFPSFYLERSRIFRVPLSH